MSTNDWICLLLSLAAVGAVGLWSFLAMKEADALESSVDQHLLSVIAGKTK